MSSTNTEARVRILYEMAMAIGNSLDLHDLLSESLKVMLRKLDGVATAAFCEVERAPLMVIPRRGLTATYRQNLVQACDQRVDKQKTPSGFVQELEVHEQRFQYIFYLKGVGLLTLVCPHRIDPHTLYALAPICEKLAASVRSCRANQQLIEKEHSLQTALCDLQKAQSARDLFLANMSHEIRTPLNGILGFLGQLEATELNDEQQHYLSIVRHSSDSLLGIINDILDFSKMDSGKMALERHPFHLLDTLEPIVELFRAKAEQQNTCLCFVQEGEIPAFIQGDALRLKQVVSNLVSNAVKFSADAQATLLLRCLAKSEDDVELQLEVIDQGIGIEAEKLKTLGEPFSQADHSTTRHFGGTGLGLAICKRLVSLMDSQLQVESEPGQGSRFYFKWRAPLATAPSDKPAQSLQTYEYPDKRVLLVEDNKVNQMLMQAILSKLKLQFDLVTDGRQALEAYQQQAGDYDLVLMDINMPVMDGVEATQHIREFELEQGWSPCPIVALTANVLKGDRERYLTMQMNDVLAKPLQLEKLHKVFAHFF